MKFMAIFKIKKMACFLLNLVFKNRRNSKMERSFIYRGARMEKLDIIGFICAVVAVSIVVVIF